MVRREFLYEFQFGRGPYDPQAPCYVHPVMAEQEPGMMMGKPPAGVVTETVDDIDAAASFWSRA